MQIIFNENPIVNKFLRPSNDENLVLSQFVLLVDVEDGCLAWNGFTHSLVFLPETSSDDIKNNLQNLDCFDELRKRHFLVSEKVDELQRLEQTRNLINNFDFSTQKFFFIFTTYACNARCPYCYEYKIPISSMSEEIAYKVAQFLIENSDDKIIHIRWFGGEPMVNSKVIDIVCDELRNNSVKFRSSMISNAYLFNENSIKHAIEKWNLEWIQITLDGPAAIYNKTKNYVGNKGNAFNHVLSNIQLFTKNKVKVNVRLNVSNDNLENFLELIDILEEKFKGNEYFRAYPKFLFDYYKHQSAEDCNKVIESCRILFDKLEDLDMLMPATLGKLPAGYNCLADSDVSFSILPNGKLNKCHHEMPLVTVGDVENGIIDEKLNNSFKVRSPYSEKCKKCFLAADCIQLKKCAHKCNEVHREYNSMWIKATLKMKYKKWKSLNM